MEEKGKMDWCFVGEGGERIGVLEIGKLKGELGIVEGRGGEDLGKGVGDYEERYFGKEEGEMVLCGDGDSVFRGRGEVVKGD
ncbi:hypothetical protein [Bacillus altitudinis]|uniref:hypothetical protein n=1 Tax=Bacillus altitudinis TaxID=293387 RepID=UPI0011A99D20|nr:hypothetical protein [Bacillus altitudinis]